MNSWNEVIFWFTIRNLLGRSQQERNCAAAKKAVVCVVLKCFVRSCIPKPIPCILLYCYFNPSNDLSQNTDNSMSAFHNVGMINYFIYNLWGVMSNTAFRAYDLPNILWLFTFDSLWKTKSSKAITDQFCSIYYFHTSVLNHTCPVFCLPKNINYETGY